ncbi:MAG: pitrilysin family protein [Acidobacteriota bacterium]
MTRKTLSNGLRLLVTENHNAPIVSLRALVRSGSDHDTAEMPGLASFVADLLDEGAGARDAILLAEDIGLLGGAMATGSDWDATYVSIDVLSRNLYPMIEIFADIVCRPRFDDDSLERVRSERLMEILQQRDEAAVIAGRRFANLLFGNATYGVAAIGTTESIARISRNEVTEFYSQHYLPNNSSIVISGDVDTDEVVRKLEGAFAGWQRGVEPQRPRVSPQSLETPRVYLIDRPQAVQSEIRIGHAGVPRSCEDYFALSVMNALLGGVFNSRINLNLREVHGYTYGARSSFAFRRQAGPFVVSAPVRNEVTRESVSEVLLELRRIRTGDVEMGELNDTKNYLMGVFPATVQSAGDVAGRLVDMELYDLPQNYFDQYRENIGGVHKAEIERVAVKYIDPDRALIVIVGNARQIREPLGTLGYEIHEMDIDGGAIA